ncbi:MAG TPA: PAS domain-containing protein, partial [Myxococcota bacterium]
MSRSSSLRYFRRAATAASAGVAVLSALWVRLGALAPELGIALAAACGLALGWALLGRGRAAGGSGHARLAALERELEERSASAQLARHREAVLAKAQRLAKVGSWRWSVTPSELIECSDSFADLFGVSKEEVFEITKHHVEQLVHPEDRERVAAVYRETDPNGGDYEISYRIIRSDGSVRYVHEIGEAVRDASGRTVEHVGASQDITEIKQIEEELKRSRDELELRVEERTAELREREALLRTAARISRMGTAIWDEMAQRYASVSEEYAQMFGCRVEEYIERFGTWELDIRDIHPDDRERFEAFDRVFRESPEESEIEYRITIPGRATQYLRDVLQPLFDAEGRHVQTIYAVQDITESKQTEEQLRQAQKMEAVGQLTG